MKKNPHCVCPYLPCPIHGYCQMCVGVSIAVKQFPNCLEPNVEACGGCLPRKRPKRTFVYESYEGMSRKCAEMIAKIVNGKPEATFCLSAEISAIRTYEILNEMQKKGEIDFSKAHFFQMNEWLDVPRSENCAAFLEKHFFAPLGIRKEQITLFDPNAEDAETECNRMDKAVELAGDFDCMLLGIGVEGQIGFNEPNMLFDSGTKVVALSPAEKKEAQKHFCLQKAPERGITFGMQQVFCAHTVILQAATKEKSEIIAQTYEQLPKIAYPATALFLVKNGFVVLDREAASLIKEI